MTTQLEAIDQMDAFNKMVLSHQTFVQDWLLTARSRGKNIKHGESGQVVFATGIAKGEGAVFIVKHATNTEVSRRSGSVCAERNLLNMFHSDPQVNDFSVVAICVTGHRHGEFVDHLPPCHVCQSWLLQEERDRREELKGEYTPIKIVTFSKDTFLVPGGADYKIKELQEWGEWRDVPEPELRFPRVPDFPTGGNPTTCIPCDGRPDQSVLFSDDEREEEDGRVQEPYDCVERYNCQSLEPYSELKSIFKELQSWKNELQERLRREGEKYLPSKRSKQPRLAIGYVVDKRQEQRFTTPATQNEAHLPQGCRCATSVLIDSMGTQMPDINVHACLKLIAVCDVLPRRSSTRVPCLQCAGMLQKVMDYAKEADKSCKRVVVMSVRFKEPNVSQIQFHEVHPEGGYRRLRIEEVQARLRSYGHPAAAL